MQREEVTQQPEHDELQTPHWVPPPPPAFGERAWFEMFFEQYGFVLATVATVLLLAFLFFNYDILLSEPEAGRTGEAAASIPLSVVTSPAGATVRVDGDSIGVSPVENHRLGRGAYFLSIRKNHYVSLDTIITLTDEPKVLAFTLLGEAGASEAARTSLEVVEPVLDAVESEEVENQADEQPDGTAEASILRPSPADPEQPPVQEDPPETTPEATSAAADEDATPPPTQPAVPAEGALHVTSDPAGATVSIDGVVAGTTPLTLNALAVGAHNVSLHMEGYAAYAASVTVAAEEVAEVAASLTARPVEVRILPKPWGAIYIDGTLLQSEVSIWYTTELTPGNHRVRVEHPSLGKWEQVINVQPGEPREIVVDFNME